MPFVIWAIASGELRIAFVLFVTAAISDLMDGFLAKRFGMQTELGAYLDPLADKVLIMSIYLTLGITGIIPRWIVILVVSRDIMIIGAVILSWLVNKPITVKPLTISKINTACQVVYASVVLAASGFGIDASWLIAATLALVTVFTLLSIGFYVAEWVRHMNQAEMRP